MSPDEDRAAGDDCLEILQSMVVSLKPQTIIESGTYPGRSTQALWTAAGTYGGDLFTYERVPDLCSEMVQKWGSISNVSFHEGYPNSYVHADLTFIDSGPSYTDRIFDIVRWMETARRDTICLVDDASEEWFTFLKVIAVVLPTQTGLAVLRHA